MTAMNPQRGDWVLVPHSMEATPSNPVIIPSIPVKVQGVTIFGEILCLNSPESEGMKVPPQHVSGIPLTAERLQDACGWPFAQTVEMGVVRISDYSTLNWYEYGLVLQTTGPYCEPECGVSEHSLSHIKHIHELQQLYRSLTGREMEIDETKL